MKKIIYLAIFTSALLVSCKKEKLEKKTISSLTLVNACSDVPVLFAQIDENPGAYQIGWYDFKIATIPEGNHRVMIYPESDNEKLAFQGNIDVHSGELFSLFVFGTQLHLENLLLKERPFKIYEENKCGVRVINLSPGSEPVNINLVEAGNHIQFPELAYKQISDFKVYEASQDQVFTFEVRRASDNSLVTSIGTTLPLHQNVTFIINGTQADNNINIYPFNHFK